MISLAVWAKVAWVLAVVTMLLVLLLYVSTEGLLP